LNVLFFLLPLVVVTAPPAGPPDTLVVCPSDYRSALAKWESYRRDQSHELLIIEPPATAEQMRVVIRKAAQAGKLKYVVIIGDEAVRGRQVDARQRSARATVPTNYVPAKVNVRWGSDAEIASDMPYADIDGDNIPDLAVGRIPVHSAAELAAVVRKVIHYEQQPDHGTWEKCLNFVSGTGGFGTVIDTAVEAAARQVIQQTVPSEYDVRHISTAVPIADATEKVDFCSCARDKLNQGSLAWIYVGHGMPTQLASASAANGSQPILSTYDVPQLHCGPHNPLAVLIACYTGAMDAPQNCLAEDLTVAEQGPVAVIAATRVTMPYGNTVIGYELLRACLRDRPAELGDVLLLAQQRVLKPTANDELRSTLDGMAALFSPAPVDLAGERREHVLMYHLIGDPLLRLHRPATKVAQADGATTKLK
jgi:hypothetical protein